MIYWFAFALLVTTVNTAQADSSYTSRRDSIGQTHFRGNVGSEHFSGTSRKDSIGQVHTNYDNGVKCVGRYSGNRYQETCHR